MSSPAFIPRFLLPVDGSAPSDSAASYLGGLASRLPGSHVAILHVRAPGGTDTATAGAAARLRQAGVAFDVLVLDGPPAEGILRCAAERRVSEIVMGSRGLGRWSGLVLGSVAMKVVQHVPLPVTVVGAPATGAPPPPGAGPQRILLASDGSRPSLRAAAYVCALRAAGLPVEVDLAAVVGPLPPPYLQENITPERLQAHYRQEGERLLHETRALLENAAIPVRSHIEAGFIIDRLLQVAAAGACHRLVLGSRGRDGMTGLLLGSVAYQALHLSPIPVTLVK
ncbi:MAG TPA: universal stress protein [Burkholderiales bacterium]|jgi:nucleotide-binding universal stress UspA family protein|nr:universal stress protein [Burkholderiales bacterium]